MDQPHSWKTVLGEKMPPALSREIDIFETEITLKKQGKLDDKIFAETRLRRGAYGQRYDNGQRHDGVRAQKIAYPSPDQTKGPDTLWDAPGMQRIKIPFGGLTAGQMETLADLAEEYSDSICHITTRQDVQLHFVSIDDTPDMFRRLAAVGITTREACGNTVRNVTACPLAGVCRDETFDVTPYANATAKFLLGHKDTQDFGRKFKIAFSGCGQHACGLAMMHDIGAIARTRTVDGRQQRGFEFYVGGGLGAVPYQAKLFEEFLPEEELLPTAQAIARVFSRLGERKNRAAARMKFLIKKLGIDEFKRLVREEKFAMPVDPFAARLLAQVHQELGASSSLGPADRDGMSGETAARGGGDASARGEHVEPRDQSPYEKWFSTNVYHQRQPGYAAVTVTLPLGDISSRQLRRLADVVRRFAHGDASGEQDHQREPDHPVRTTVEQNILLRGVRESEIPDLYRALAELALNEPGAESIVDITACPGTDTCKLGIASSRGLAAVLRERLMARELQYDDAVRNLRIKISGCFNSCGQHHIADIGFYGSSRLLGGYTVPHFQLLLGGEWKDNAVHYGLAVGALPSKRIPEVVDRLIDRYLRERQNGEAFRIFMGRIGKKEVKAMLDDLFKVPPHAEDASFYSDWHDSREFTIGDMAAGECAGEVVSMFEFDIAAAEREVFEAQLLLDVPAAVGQASALAYKAMLSGAWALERLRNIDASVDPDEIVSEFRKQFYDTQLFFDRFAGGKFAHYLFIAHDTRGQDVTAELAHQRVEEAQLFIEAAHACRGRAMSVPGPGPGPAQAAVAGLPESR